MKKVPFSFLIALLGLQCLPGGLGIRNQGTAHARNDWKQEFSAVCGKTQHAMELSPAELQSYIDRCNRLENRLDELNGPEGSEKKVYAKRLKMCKDLYLYTLEVRGNTEKLP